jgi:uncharacterized protein (UPF0332 family)
VTDENRLANARAEAVLGDDAVRAAKALLGLELWNDAVSRAYYAAFHYARVLLLLEGLEPKTHRGVIALLSAHYERSDRLGADLVSAFARLQTFRGLADDDARERLSRERAETEVAAAERFVRKAQEILAVVTRGSAARNDDDM